MSVELTTAETAVNVVVMVVMNVKEGEVSSGFMKGITIMAGWRRLREKADSGDVVDAYWEEEGEEEGGVEKMQIEVRKGG